MIKRTLRKKNLKKAALKKLKEGLQEVKAIRENKIPGLCLDDVLAGTIYELNKKDYK